MGLASMGSAGAGSGFPELEAVERTVVGAAAVLGRKRTLSQGCGQDPVVINLQGGCLCGHCHLSAESRQRPT